MTNKLPEVGKRYKNKAWNKESEIKEIYFMVKIGQFEPIRLDEFWGYFEELPDPQEKPEVQLTESIWKPANELPKFIKEMGYPNLIIKFQDGNIKYGSFQNDFYADMRGHAFKQQFVKKWCYLTDFINDIEQTKLDHEERLRKLEGNDI